MIGQLRNNLRRGISVAAMSITLFAAPAFAETISGQLIYTDWYVLVKDESGVQTVVARGNLERSVPRPTSVQFNINEKASGKNYLYIIAGSHPKDGLDPFLAATLRGTKTLNTGDKAIEVFQSDYTDINAPTNTVMIREIIEGGMGGGTFGPSFPAIYGNSQKLIGKFSGQGIWAKGQIDNGHAVVFRIPYSALLNSPSEPKALTPSISGITQGVTVDIDVREILGSVFAKKGKKKDIPKDENKTPTDNLTPIIIEETPVTFVTSQLPAETEAVVKNDPVIITRPPEIITRYVQDPNLLRDRNRLRDERKNMVEHIGGLTEVIKRQESTIREINNNLNKKENAANSTLALLKERDKTIKSLQIKLNTKVPPIGERETSLPLIPLAAGGLGLLSFGGLLGWFAGRPKAPKRPLTPPSNIPRLISRDNLERGMVFAPSQMMVGSSSLPLSLAAIKSAYDAVGRIGFAQEGKPIGEDESFGTGILISEKHILTNRHVWEMFKDRLVGNEGTGIEFFGEKKSDKSDFIPFDGNPPICIDGWDAAIFILSRTPENRQPVSMMPRPAAELNNLDIVVVGYPQAHRITEEIAEVTEKDPIFGIKRYSEGKIFKHSSDDRNPYGVEAFVEEVINSTEYMPAICHNASTLGGSSGSAIICKKTGELIALHFGFDSALEWEEAANLGVAGENLTESINKIINNVTPVTDDKLCSN